MGPGRATWLLRLSALGVLLVVLPAAVLIHQTQRNPDVMMLPGGSSGAQQIEGGDWMLWRPGDWRSGVADDYWAAMVRRPGVVHFQGDYFQAGTDDHPGELVLRALGNVEVELNGRVLAPVRAGADWKQASVYDLASSARVGRNHLTVHVFSAGRMALLQVTGPVNLATPVGWRAFVDGEDAQAARPVVTLGELARIRPASWTDWRVERWIKAGIILWVALGLGMMGWVLWRMVRARHGEPEATRLHIRRREGLILGALVLAVGGLHGWSAWRVEAWRGPDTQGHMDHIRLVARTGRPTIATDCWECYQPPGYYYVAASVYRAAGGDGQAVGAPVKTAPDLGAFKAVQLSGALWGMGLMLATWALVGVVEPRLNLGGKITAVGFVGLAPIAITSAPLVNSSLFAGLVSTLVLLLAVRTLQRCGTEPMSWRQAGLLGLAVGAALLVKFSAVLLAVALLLVWGLSVPIRRCRWRGWVAMGVFGLGVLGVCGWYYGRNVMMFGQPFYGNWQADAHTQAPTFRWLGYYLRLGDFLFAHPDSVRWTSWWDGLYVSFWTGDAARYFLADWMTRAMLTFSLLPVLAWPATLSLGLGLGRTLAGTLRRTWDAPARIDCLLVALIWLHGGALMWFGIRVPADGTVTARYALELLPVLAVMLARGRGMVAKSLPVGRWLLDASLIVLATAVLGAWWLR